MISAPAEVVVFLAEVTEAKPSLLRFLEPSEQERASTFMRARDRDRFVASHALLRLAAGEVFGVPPASVRFDFTCSVCGGSHGRPSLLDPLGLPGVPGRFGLSLSTTPDHLAVAVARKGDIGVDIDRVDAAQFPGFDTVALAAREVRAVERLDPTNAATARARLWVRKEAVVKASGHGMRRDPRAIDVWVKQSRHTGTVDVAGAAVPEPTRVRWIDFDTGVNGLSGAVARVGLEPVDIAVRDARRLLTADSISGSH
ncbi:4'-phosphopantetheinyl transferase family protein [Subtercola frigoramans]|uniref:4'-phosphopantetheinyl transferase n=1 Tax=Subtercola frigoramans TaxID=120298 RepID=A0ABS2L6E8_9MICO|nr:4'-phosphopantetheinyl transferase superfamily protein [Subtercola frigoramans]MBM7472673.1 4'-phosphopantetheinyl transferase [Subtercola frigoramans]